MMDDQDRAELAALKQRQRRLGEELRIISNQLLSLEERMGARDHPREKDPQLPPTLEQGPAQQPSPAELLGPVQKPPPLPQVVSREPVQGPFPGTATELTAQATPEKRSAYEAAIPPSRAESVPGGNGGGSLELRLGTFWAPRIGIVVLLTGLVFLGNLAYQSLGRPGRVLLLYLASGILLGAGWWWQRRTVKEALRNYAQVLFAGGLAALYFTTYAAHHLETLRVIASPVLDGALLLACAGLMVWTADRWKSEVLALFGAGLAYYTCIITRVGSFTLYSNLVLTVAAVFFLVRNRWATLTFGSVIASYGAYAFWRFFSGTEWQWPSPAEGLWSGAYFLVAYWIVFTAGVFLTRDEKFSGRNRATFLTLNNGAFFTSFLLTILQVGDHTFFWRFALLYGAVLVVLAEVARTVLRSEPLAKDFYLSQGLLLVTIGFISKFAGLHLALVLAGESVLLLLMGQARKSNVLLTAAYVTSGLSVGWAIDGMRLNEPTGIYLAIGVGALMLTNTLLVHRAAPAATATPLLRPDRSYFTVLALTTWLVATFDNTTAQNFPLVLALEGVALTLSIYLLRIREISVLSQAFVIIAQIAWTLGWLDQTGVLPWWNPALLLSLNLLLCHWWQRQKLIDQPWQMPWVWQEIYALSIVAILWCWLGGRCEASEWLLLTSGLTIALTAYGVLTRAWPLAATGQLFMAISVTQFAWQLYGAKPPWAVALVPLAALLVLSWATVEWFRRKPDSDPRVRSPLLGFAVSYRWVAIAMANAWITQYLDPREHTWALALVGLVLFLWAGWKKNPEGLLASCVFTGAGLVLFWIPVHERPVVYWPNLCALLVLLSQQQIARRLTQSYPLDPWVHPLIILAGGLSVWRFSTVFVMNQASGFYLTASWSALALVLLAGGILLRERAYRWLGLGVLGCALGRIVIFDVWKLQTVYRILSFMALGIVLLVLGYIYSKFQDKIKEWL